MIFEGQFVTRKDICNLKVSFHYAILGMMLEKIQFCDTLTPTYDATHN